MDGQRFPRNGLWQNIIIIKKIVEYTSGFLNITGVTGTVLFVPFKELFGESCIHLEVELPNTQAAGTLGVHVCPWRNITSLFSARSPHSVPRRTHTHPLKGYKPFSLHC